MKNRRLFFLVVLLIAELMAQWQAIALNVKPKRPVRDYTDLRFVNEVLIKFDQK
jgi:hypothetical protein